MTKAKVSRQKAVKKIRSTKAKSPKDPAQKKAPVPRYKTLGDEPGFEYTESVVESGLKKVFQPFFYRLLIPFINDDVKEVSEFMAIYSLYVKHIMEFKCTEEGKNDDPEFFSKLSVNFLRSMFADIRDSGGKFGFDLVRASAKTTKPFNTKNRSHVIANLLQQFAVNFQTNLKSHLQSRLFMYFNKFKGFSVTAANKVGL